MVTIEELVELGFSEKNAVALSQKSYFQRRLRRASKSTLESNLENIERIYGVSRNQSVKAVFSFPQFAEYNHSRVLKEAQDVYGVSKGAVVKAVFYAPPFAGLDHFRVLDDIQNIYGVSKEVAVKAVFSFPPFAGFNHSLVLKDISDIYGVSREKVVKAVFKAPRFARRDHVRVLRQIKRFAKLLGLNKKTIIDYLFENPVIAGYSWKRNIASVDAIRRAVKRTGVNVSNEEMFQWYMTGYGQSPYAAKDSKAREGTLEARGELTKPSDMGKAAESWLKNRKKRRHLK